MQPVGVEVVRMERADHEPAVVRNDAPRLGEGARTVDEVQHERHRDTVEPSVAKRQLLCRPLPDADLEAGLVETESRSFLVYPNYDAILRYNCAHHYALSVALLADRLQ